MKKFITMLTIIFGMFISNSNVNAEDGKVSSEKSSRKVLVVYFSPTGTTKRVAEFIAADLKSEIFEIVPEVAYTNDDLNWRDNNSRSMKEKEDKSARPAIKNKVADFSQYDIVFLGYPIWWGQAPRIVNTFIESNNFNGKIVVPFVTSGSSGIGSSTKELEKITKGATWKEGKRFSSSSSEAEVRKWVENLRL